MKKTLFIAVVIVLVLIINGLLVSIYDLWQKQDLIVSAQKELEAEKLKNQKLKAELSYAKTSSFLDEQARNKLFLVKEGEQKVFISENLLVKNDSDAAEVEKELPNWQKWINLFF